MHWSRTGNPIDLAAGLLLCALVWAGGYLLAGGAFRLNRRERPLVGLATGWLVFIVLSNLAAYLLPLSPAFWTAAGLTLGLGLLAAWRSPERPLFSKADLKLWPQLAALAGLVLLFALINRGLAIFDDYHNLPLVSTLAAGDVPPNFYLNATERLSYHYGLHLFAAMLVRVGGFFPWGAFDLSKALALAVTLLLGWLWFRRTTGSARAAGWGAALLLFAGGARWLLLLAPVSWLTEAGKNLQFLGSAAAYSTDLYAALLGPWKIEGAGPFPFSFAFVNGIFPPLSFALGSNGALPQMTVILLLLVARRRLNKLASLVTGLLLASLALTGEHLLVLVGFGLAAVLVYGLITKQVRPAALAGWAAALGTAGLLSLLGGGVVTEMARSLLLPSGQAGSGTHFTGFALRWPPAAISAHLGTLSLTSPAQLLIALAETGPVLLLAGWALPMAVRRLRRGGWMASGLGLGSLVGILAPLGVQYLDHDRDITRLASAALFIWLVLGFPLLWFQAQNGRPWRRYLLAAGFGLTIAGGLFSFAPQLVSIAAPQFSYFISEADALASRQYWNQLEPGAQVFDRLPYRAVSLFGRTAGRAYSTLYEAFPEWEGLAARFDPLEIAGAGYSYIYLDKETWQDLTIEQKQVFQKPCVQVVTEPTTQERDYRRLLDVRQCASQ